METQIFHPAKTFVIFKKKSSKKETKILQRYYNSRPNLRFQHKPKKISSLKNPHIKIDLIIIT
jgi:hypothetical protein